MLSLKAFLQSANFSAVMITFMYKSMSLSSKSSGSGLKLDMKTHILALLLTGLSLTFSNVIYASGFTISSCSVSSLTDGSGSSDTCSYGTKSSGISTGNLDQTTLDSIDNGGWGLAGLVVKSDTIGSGLTITANSQGTAGTWSLTDFNLTEYFESQGGFDSNFLLDALFVIKTSTAFEWFVFEPLTGTITSGIPILLDASGSWNTSDFYKLDKHGVDTGIDPAISHLSVYFRQSSLSSTTVVPIPAAVWLFGSGLTLMFAFLRRRSSGGLGEDEFR